MNNDLNESSTNDEYLKTVSAFANYGGGAIILSDNDRKSTLDLDSEFESWCVTDLSDPWKARQHIEEQTKELIIPCPKCEFIFGTGRRGTIFNIIVHKGRNLPYTYLSKAYKRNNTELIEADESEFSRLVRLGKNINYEKLPAARQDLAFSYFEGLAMREACIEKLNTNVLKAFDLYSESDGFNRAAELLADENDYPGIDMIWTGGTKNIAVKTINVEHKSILLQIEEAMNVFWSFYQYDKIQGNSQIKIERIPEKAFRAVIVSVVLNKTGDETSNTCVSMFNDRIEISIPNEIPVGVSYEHDHQRNIIMFRNRILKFIFYRLHLIDKLVTDFSEIKEMYHKNEPVIERADDKVKITLPVCCDSDLTDEEILVYSVLSSDKAKTLFEILKEIPLNDYRTKKALNRLAEENYVIATGNRRGKKYKRA